MKELAYISVDDDSVKVCRGALAWDVAIFPYSKQGVGGLSYESACYLAEKTCRHINDLLKCEDE